MLESVWVVSYSPPSDRSFRYVAKRVFSTEKLAKDYVERETVRLFGYGGLDAIHYAFELIEFQLDLEE